MEEKKQTEMEIDLGEIMSVLWSKALIIVLTGLLFAVLAFLGTKFFIEPTYKSTASIYIVNRQGDGLTTSDLSSAEMLTKDCQKIITNRTVLDVVIDTLQLDMSAEALANQISVSVPTDTRIIEITVTNQNPNKAKEIVDTVADVTGEKLQEIMGIEEVNVFEYGNLPLNPSAPNVMKNSMMAGFVGIALAAFIIILLFIMDDTIKSSDDVSNYLGLTTIGFIPDIADHETAGNASKKKRKRGEKKC